jgi:hypothetical protein
MFYLKKLKANFKEYVVPFIGILSKDFIVVVDYSHGRILQVNIDTGGLVKLPISATNSPGIMLDKLKMELFYSEVTTKAIMSTTLHGKNTTLIHTIGCFYWHL